MTGEERRMLKEQVSREIIRLENLIETLTELIMDGEIQSDANDWFTTKESNPSKEINELSLAKSRQRLLVLRNLISRIDTPGFGKCERCGNPIPFARLKAVPAATRCLSCS